MSLEKFGIGGPGDIENILALTDKKLLDQLVQVTKPKKLGLFDYLNILTYNKQYITVDNTYSSYMIDKGFALHLDTISYAAHSNRLRLSGQYNFDYYYHAISKSNRRASWPKLTDGVKEYIFAGVLSKFWDCSIREAKLNISYLSNDDIEYYRKRFKNTYEFWVEHNNTSMYTKELIKNAIKELKA